MTDFINNFRAIHHFVKGILSNGRGEYNLTFVQDPDGRWYIDMPWGGNRANLEMVAGSDDLLSYLDTDGRHRVTIHVVPSERPIEVKGHVELRQIDKSLTGGSTTMQPALLASARAVSGCVPLRSACSAAIRNTFM